MSQYPSVQVMPGDQQGQVYGQSTPTYQPPQTTQSAMPTYRQEYYEPQYYENLTGPFSSNKPIPPPTGRKYRIKRQEPGCCWKCNSYYGGCCDNGGSCAGCNCFGCCDRPRVIYEKDIDELFEAGSISAGKKKVCC